MPEHTLDSFTVFGLFLLLYYLCLYNDLHIVGAQISEEGGGRTGKKEEPRRGIL